MSEVLTVGQMRADLERWRTWVRAEVDRLVELACRSSLEGGGAWDEVMGRWGVEPLTADERRRHATTGPARSRGPPPIEQRHVIRALAAYTATQLHEFERVYDPPVDICGSLDRLVREVGWLEEEALRRYIGRVRPKTTTASIFANARASSRRHLADAAQPGVSTSSCPSCGAPRTSVATRRVCEFCGGAT